MLNAAILNGHCKKGTAPATGDRRRWGGCEKGRRSKTQRPTRLGLSRLQKKEAFSMYVIVRVWIQTARCKE
jgi:hypothetical protein